MSTIHWILNNAYTTGIGNLTTLKQFPMLNRMLYQSMGAWIDLVLDDAELQALIREHGLKQSCVRQMTLNYLMIRLRNFKGCSSPMVVMDLVLSVVRSRGPEHALALLEAHVKNTAQAMCRKLASRQAAA